MLRPKFSPILVWICILGLCPLLSEAAVLARYTFNDNTDVSTDDDESNTFSTAGNLVVAGLPTSTFVTTTGTNTTPARSAAGADTGGNSEAAAITAGDYFEFTVTPQAGYELDLTSLSLDFDTSYNSQPRGYGIRSSLNGYADTSFDYVELAGSGTGGTFLTQTYILSDALYQNITDPVTFRIYVFDNATGGGSIMRYDNITLFGTAPEPTRVLLMFAGLGFLVMRRRR